jgi:hypothetical protein
MEQHINTYQGLNKDVAADSIPNTMYIDALDVRITTTTGESMGAFTNIKGNEFTVSIPQEGEWGPYNWQVTGIAEVIGFTNIRNTIILFVADESDSNGWIYVLNYDETTLNLNSLDLVYYNPDLNFSKASPIEAIGRYESPDIQRVYWTDYKNYLRSINIVSPDLTTTPVETLDAFPNMSYTQPLLKSMVGGSLLVGEYQVAYLLRTLDGKETLISPPSNLIHVTNTSETLPQSAQYHGNVKGTPSGKGLQMTIDTTNYLGSFAELDVILVFHEDLNGTPEVTFVETHQITTNTLDFIITGTEITQYPIEYLTYTLKNYPFKTCKTLTQKDDSLVVANILSSSFYIQDVLDGQTFDARTYRYKSDGTTNNDEFNEDYNLDAHWDPQWHATKQYRYQSDGARLGGEGPNIRYSFHLEPFTIDGNNPVPGFANVSNNPDSFPHDLNDSYTYNNTTFPNNASPFLSGLLYQFKRGETYRFGLVCYNLKGEASFVEHIGDVKFPDISEEDSINNASTTPYFPTTQVVGGINYGYALGIQFSINFPSNLLDNISGYQIVRVKRTNNDMRRASQGIVKPFWFNNVDTSTPPGSIDFDLRDPNNSNKIYHLMPYYLQGPIKVPNGTFATMNRDILPEIDASHRIEGHCLSFYSPEISFNHEQIKDLITSTANNPCLLMTGAYRNYSLPEFSTKDLSSIDLGTYAIDRRQNLRYSVPITFNSNANIRRWDKNRYINMLDSLTAEDDANLLQFDNYYAANTSYYLRNWYAADDLDGGSNLNDPSTGYGSVPYSPTFFKGGTSIFGQIKKIRIDPLTQTLLPVNTQEEYFETGSLIGPIDITLNLNTIIPIIDTLLPKIEVYGGYTQSSLEANVFVPASPVIPKTSTTPIVYGGDTFLNVFTSQVGMAGLETKFYDNPGVTYNQNESRTDLYVTESFVNLDLTSGSTLKTGVKYTFDSFEDTVLRQEVNNSFIGYATSNSMYAYNSVYSRQNIDVSFFVKPQNLASGDNAGRNDIRAYLSNRKINREVIDSWTKFGALNYYDVDDYGPINKILNWRDTVYFFQDRGVGAYAINRSAITTTTDGVPTQLGTGKGFGKHQYLTKEHGSIHQWAVKATDTGIYYFDSIHKKIFTIAEGNQPLSELKGVHSLINYLQPDCYLRKENGGDNPILSKGIHIGKDKVNDEVLFTFLAVIPFRELINNTQYFINDIVVYGENYYLVIQNFTTTSNPSNNLALLIIRSIELPRRPPNIIEGTTLVYDELSQAFSSRYSATPTLWIENGDIILSPNPTQRDNLYTHNIGKWGQFYDNYVECSLSLVINPQADINKILRTLEFNSIVRDDNKVIDRTKTITAFRINNEYQDTLKVPFSSGRIKRKFDKWRVKIPRDQNTINKHGRLRSSYFILTLYFDNSDNKELIMNRVMSYFDYQQF